MTVDPASLPKPHPSGASVPGFWRSLCESFIFVSVSQAIGYAWAKEQAVRDSASLRSAGPLPQLLLDGNQNLMAALSGVFILCFLVFMFGGVIVSICTLMVAEAFKKKGGGRGQALFGLATMSFAIIVVPLRVMSGVFYLGPWFLVCLLAPFVLARTGHRLWSSLEFFLSFFGVYILYWGTGGEWVGTRMMVLLICSQSIELSLFSLWLRPIWMSIERNLGMTR